MRILYYIPLLAILSCNNQTKQAGTKLPADSKSQVSEIAQIDNAKYYTTKDSLLISFVTGDTLKYGKEAFNEIVANHPELVSDKVQDPDLTYYCRADKKGFNSEVGQDEYYLLYAYFLQQKNGIDKFKDCRKNLSDIYSGINAMFQRLQHGGTYFGHQTSRIPGYAEFSVYLYKSYKDHFSRSYDITRQKNLYIQSLRQLIKDETAIEFETLGQERVERSKELNKIVDVIDKAITDNFYLGRAQEFHYRHYQYY